MTKERVAIKGAFGALLVAVAMVPGPASAILIDRGDGLIYDDVLDVTWLQDASLGGSRGWDNANRWAAGLVFGGFDDWRLPSMDVNGDTNVVDCSVAMELACRDNELGYMFYQNLGGQSGDNLTGDQGLIQNIQAEHWSGTEVVSTPLFAWAFNFDGGSWVVGTKNIFDAAWAVRPGDVMAVPEPGTLGLLSAGLAVLGFGRRRRRHLALP